MYRYYSNIIIFLQFRRRATAVLLLLLMLVWAETALYDSKGEPIHKRITNIPIPGGTIIPFLDLFFRNGLWFTSSISPLSNMLVRDISNRRYFWGTIFLSKNLACHSLFYYLGIWLQSSSTRYYYIRTLLRNIQSLSELIMQKILTVIIWQSEFSMFYFTFGR